MQILTRTIPRSQGRALELCLCGLGVSVWTHRILQPWLGLGTGQGCPSSRKSTPGIVGTHKTTLKYR